MGKMSAKMNTNENAAKIVTVNSLTRKFYKTLAAENLFTIAL